MAVKVTIDIFSGRENPTVVFKGAEAKELLKKLSPTKRVAKDFAQLPPFLGYRGMSIEIENMVAEGLPNKFNLAAGRIAGPRLLHSVSDPTVEDFVCGSTGVKGIPIQGFTRFLGKEIERLRDIIDRLGEGGFRPPGAATACDCGPLYEPAWWNDASRVRLNNCYNYSTNYRTDTFAQPGRAAGSMYTALTCASVRPAAVRDDLMDSTAADNKCPSEGHLVALVIAPGYDYHWYRKDRTGKWSHKPGGTPATNVDNAGAVITDPRNAARGPYTEFCTFMVVMHGHIRVK